MDHLLAASTPYYRVTRQGSKFADAISGHGAFHHSGGRYNRAHQRTVYSTDDPLVAITETAYYQAREWQGRVGGGQPRTANSLRQSRLLAPLTFPFVSSHSLWCFTLDSAPYVVDVDDPFAFKTFRHDPLELLNPSQDYGVCRDLADLVRDYTHPTYSKPRGLKAPSARTPALGGDQPCQYVFFVIGKKIAARMAWQAELMMEFLDPGGDPVGKTTRRVDWSRPRIELSNPTQSISAGNALPNAIPIQPNQWHTIEIDS